MMAALMPVSRSLAFTLTIIVPTGESSGTWTWRTMTIGNIVISNMIIYYLNVYRSDEHLFVNLLFTKLTIT